MAATSPSTPPTAPAKAGVIDAQPRPLPTDQNFTQVISACFLKILLTFFFKISSDLAEEFMKVVRGTSADGWVLVEQDSDGVKVEKKKYANSEVLCFRGTGT